MAEQELLTSAKLAEKIGVSAGKVAKYLREQGIQPDVTKGRCGYYGAQAIAKVEQALKPR
ncbi:MAG: hypothetical protein GXX83_05560 [Gaiellales bacterium]|nr:hypothetical protein [Gaiellales bacterium]